MSIEVRPVANGWIAQPAFDPTSQKFAVIAHSAVHVFQSFEALAAWLKENVKPLEAR